MDINKIKKAVEWSEGVKRNESSFTAGSNAAADVVLELYAEIINDLKTNVKD